MKGTDRFRFIKELSVTVCLVNNKKLPICTDVTIFIIGFHPRSLFTKSLPNDTGE